MALTQPPTATGEHTRMLSIAQQYVTAGLSLLPIRADGSKMPNLRTWKELQVRLPTPAELRTWFGNGSTSGLAIIGGQVSHSLEILDFDDHAIYQEFLLAAEATGLAALVNRIRDGCEEASPNGAHLPYYCSTIEGNKKLAKRPATPEELQVTPDDSIKGLIETRGEGGYVIAAPSSGTTHRSGKPYVLLQGSWLTVATITPEEREDLWDLCRTFDRMPPREADSSSPPPRHATTSMRPGDLFAAAVSWAEILEPAGWTHIYRKGEVDYWRRPGKGEGISATTNYAGSDYFYCFSSSTVFDPERGYGKFSAYAWLHYKGDFHAASLALLRKGYGLPEQDDPSAPMRAEEWTDTTQAHDPPTPEDDPPAPLPDDPHIRFTDAGNGKRFARRYGEGIRYCTTWKSFLVWDGKRWARDQEEQVARWARETIFGIYEEGQHYATRATDTALGEEERKRYALKAEGLLKHAVKSESGPRIKEMMQLVKMDVTILPDRLDADPWVLNCQNGAVDLRTGILHPHRRDEYLTKITSVVYDPQARCPVWEAFLDRIMDGRQDLIAYLQRAVGYSLTGDTREQCLFLGYGEGQNGKSTFINNLREICGDYGQQAAFTTFLHKDRDVVRNDLAALRGARLVAAIEAEEGRRFAETIIKQVTGQDKIRARFLFQEEFEFLPQFKLWFGVNHKPVITGTDLGIWRRIQMIPFTVTIPQEERDDLLNEKLQTEWPGILAWAIRGCLAWQKDGLQIPESVRSATNEYRTEMDSFSQWLSECCEQQPQVSARSSDLYASYQNFTNDKITTQTAFGRRLRKQGFIKEKNPMSYVVWRGVKLLDTGASGQHQEHRYGGHNDQ